ncbi:hypothetical protein DB313_05345 (plasmid) [Borrelia turcica IST7]|uniref:Uncharacterized protein n=1 Tax=Borrelia turcica IST7 TaxID=1104446 RepID=A0A386PPI1_9SPIR|nr:hypothetical protein DB313_05345 [Borrelia turcica IST7]
MPYESFTLDKSKLNQDLLKIINPQGSDQKTIILIAKKGISMLHINKANDNLFIRDDSTHILILNSKDSL